MMVATVNLEDKGGEMDECGIIGIPIAPELFWWCCSKDYSI
jgi:hypothetical protein